jgi:lipid-binding SYLF domain-containing protein
VGGGAFQVLVPGRFGMKRWSSSLWVVVWVMAFFVSSAVAGTEEEKIENAGEILEQIMAIPEKGIPPHLLANAQAIALIPNVIKVGFVIGGRHGSGIIMVRNDAGLWSDPVFITITGGSLGWQIGAQSTDVVLVFRNRRSIENIIQGKITLGADAAIAAGPVGRRIEGATDVELKAEIFSYSRSRGLFAGISLEGSSLQIDDQAVERFYGSEVRARDVATGKVRGERPEVKKLHNQLEKYAADR